MKRIVIGREKTTELDADKLGGQVITAIIEDIATTNGEWKRCRYVLEFEVNIEEPELQIRDIVIKPIDSKALPPQDNEAISDFKKELEKL